MLLEQSQGTNTVFGWVRSSDVLLIHESTRVEFVSTGPTQTVQSITGKR